MIKIIEGNVFDSDAQVIAHQVNCQGVMGSGVAAEVKARCPEVYREYHRHCARCKAFELNILGEVFYVDVLGNVFNGTADGQTYTLPIIANIYGQDTFGYNGVYTKYSALESGFRVLYNTAKHHGWKVAMPYMIGCVLGGGDWNVVYYMIKEIFIDVDVELWKLTL